MSVKAVESVTTIDVEHDTARVPCVAVGCAGCGAVHRAIVGRTYWVNGAIVSPEEARTAYRELTGIDRLDL